MNPTLLQDYNKRLEIAKAKIEVCDMMIQQIKDRSDVLRKDEGIAVRTYASIMHEFELQKLFIASYCKQLKQSVFEDWQRLEPKREDYGWVTGDDSWDCILNVQCYNMAHARWEGLEPFKTTENEQH